MSHNTIEQQTFLPSKTTTSKVIVGAPHPQTGQDGQGIQPSAILNALRRRWLLGFVLGVILSGAATAAAWIGQEPEYVATRTIEIKPARPKILFETADNAGSGAAYYKTFKHTQHAMLLQPNLLNTAFRDFSNDELLQITGQPPERQIPWLQENLEVGFPNDSQIMTVSMKSTDKESAIRIVNAIVDAYENEVVTKGKNDREERLAKLEEVYDVKAGDVRKTRETLKKLAENTGMSDAGTLNIAQQSNLQLWTQLQTEYIRRKMERRNLDAELTLLKKLESIAENRDGPDGDGTQAESDEHESSADALRPRSVPVSQVLFAPVRITDEQVEEAMGLDRVADELQEKIDKLNERIAKTEEGLSASYAAKATQRYRNDRDDLEAELDERRELIRTQLRKTKTEEQKKTLAAQDAEFRRRIYELRRQQLARAAQHQNEVASNVVDHPQSQPTSRRAELARSLAELEPAEVIEARLEVLSELEDELSQEVDDKREEVRDYGVKSVDAEMLRADIAAEEAVMMHVRREKEQSEIEKDALPQITVAPPTTNAYLPDPKKRIAITCVAGVAGLFLPLMLLVVHDIRKRHVDDMESVTTTLKLDHLGSIPRIPSRIVRNLNHRDSASHRKWRTRLTESVLNIVALLNRKCELEDQRCILISSAMPGEGKSTISIEVARNLAQAGRNVILVDFDLRRPSIHTAFQKDLEPGVADVLSGESELFDAIQESGIDNLDLMVAGHREKNLISGSISGTLDQLFSVLKEKYDFVIVDGCPVLPVVDARVVGQHVDGVIMSLIRDVSQLPQVVKACEIMKSYGATIIGTVVMSDENGEHYYYNRQGYGDE